MTSFYEPHTVVKKVSTSTADMYLLENGIVHYVYKEAVDIDVPKHMENHYALLNLVGNEKHPLLIQASELITFTAEARLKVKELEPLSPVLARAFVTDSLGHKLLINFYIRFNKPVVPNKVFSDYVSAIEWLLKMRTNNF